MIAIPNMLMIGSAGRNAGKTEFACSLIRRFSEQNRIVAVKVTAIHEKDGTCPRGGIGCGVCSSLEGDYCITEETDRSSPKDTAKLLAAGAERVYWLRVLKARMNEGLEALLTMIGRDAIIICESNSLRLVTEPGVFVMVKSGHSDHYKQSAKDVKDLADKIVNFEDAQFDVNPDEIKLIDGKWVLRLPATVIILAGGHSERMGRDKSLLPIGGRPMIEHVYRQLEPHFRRILVSANDPDKYAFLGLEVIPDKMPDQGPLMGIASALEASDNDLNLVVACDIPQIDIRFVQDMFRQADGFDAVVPVGEGSLAEPLFAVYRKSVLGSALEALSAGKRRVRDVFDRCRVKFVDLPEKPWLKNLNTPEEYEQALRDRNA